MLTRLFVFLMLLSSAASAQSNATVNRLLVKDSMSIGGRWIREIKSDSTMQGTSEGTISTDGAWKSYILNTVRNSPLSPVPGPPRDSALTIDPVTGKPAITKVLRKLLIKQDSILFRNPWLKVSMLPPGNGGAILEDTIYVKCTSSDGIESVVSFNGGYPDWNYAKGIPPFKVAIDLVNKYPGKIIQLEVRGGFVPNSFNVMNLFIGRYNDTIHFEQKHLNEPIEVLISLLDSLKNYKSISMTVRNRTSSMINMEVPGGVNKVLPGEDLCYEHWYSSNLYFTVNGVSVSKTGIMIVVGRIRHQIRYQIYENGILTNTIQEDLHSNMPIPIKDPTAKIEIVLEDR
ncbi:hypothetical protein CLV59_109163 [Chitinophaga dinghuensis]|uniref:Uncharacterized protein n=1 Tax=Chitinophaga dinghuensis TaxID=1539050 RepID=A0A327VQ45_9BACT|nr:hypothetical protein [Chitinophaga dinghuensis]RAJ75549.1 hypothetical protein CLV59_109163 [Chitinophaga dinghuensis]